MKKLDAIPTEVLRHIQSEHERALAKILTSDTAIASLPTRPVQMRILRPSHQDSTNHHNSANRYNSASRHSSKIETVIAPPVSAYISKSSIIDGTLLTTSAIRYVLPYTGEPFPYGHVFRSSGYVCLGSIFVPSTVSIYNPQQPLETLFLHNDRNTGHGGASVTINKDILANVIKTLNMYNIELSSDAAETLVTKVNLLRNDAIWILSADVVKQAVSLSHATDIMDVLFRIIFRANKVVKGE